MIFRYAIYNKDFFVINPYYINNLFILFGNYNNQNLLKNLN